MTYKLGDGENATQIAKYKYSYDSNGNITEVWDGNNKIAKYQYDSLNQLKVAWDYQQLLKFYYNYDNSGNIESSTYQSLTAGYEDYVTGNPHSANYYYRDSDWGDLLTEYKGTTLTYDAIGNPTNYRDGIEMSWSGRELKSLNKSGYTYNFTYNLDGLRTKRTKEQNNTVLETVNYYYDDSNNLLGLKKGTTTVLFYYDSDGKVHSMTKGDDTYFFVKNLQGDVTKIIDEDGETCATYAYDAWGALLTENEDSSIEGFNPFRYRGYVYDNETELYYLQSRYYDPKTGRFINADDSAYTDTGSVSPLSTNMFAYCENNAISGYDPTGHWDKKTHFDLNKKANFSKVTYQASYLADAYFPSGGGYSSPFHSRDGKHSPSALEIFKKIYNTALAIKKMEKTNCKKFKYVDKETSNPFDLPKKYFAFLKKSDWTYTTKIKRAEKLLNYLNGQENNDLKKKNFSQINNTKDQANALLGLALHTLQDYYAHLITVTGCFCYENGQGKSIGVIPKYNREKPFPHTMTATNDLITPYQKSQIEDNINFLPWRYEYISKFTKDKIYTYYVNNRYINFLSAKTSHLETTIFYVGYYRNPKNLLMGDWMLTPPKKTYSEGYKKFLLNYFYVFLDMR